MLKNWSPLNLNHRAWLAIAHDALMLALAALITSWLVTGNWLAVAHHGTAWQLALVACAQLAINLSVGLYHGLWRYASLPDVQRLLVACTGGALIAAVLLLSINVPGLRVYAAIFTYGMVLLAFMAGSRVVYRSVAEYHLYGRQGGMGKPVLVLGAGDTAVNLLKALTRSPDWRVEGLLDDDDNKRNRIIHGFRVLGPLDDLPKIAKARKVEHAVIAMPYVPYAVRRRVVDICKRSGVKVMTVPLLNDAMASLGPPKMRRLAVDDLLKRDPVTLDDAGLHDFLTGKVVMVTGAGGSIGSELCRQIAAYQPSLLVLFEQNEYAMYRIEEDLREQFPNLPVADVIGDIKNQKRVSQAMHQYSPAIVFHAAAYKHVPLMEETNCWEAVQNNAYGTYTVARAAIDYGVKRFVLVSTDKAVNPTNVMGASKRLSEMICQALQQVGDTRFEIVRFGNVLGSAGSVIPKFQEQIDRGGPVTVTHPDMVRYFMSIPEAAQLVMQAGAMGLGGEIFVLDMGEPVRIVDLARDMIRLSESDAEIKIVYTGLRPGEKLFEELLADDEHTRPTPHPKLRIAKARDVDPSWVDELLPWFDQERVPTDSEVRRDLKRWVPEYQSQIRPKLRLLGSAAAAD